MGYREYLKDNQAERPGLLSDVRHKLRTALLKVGSIHQDWLAEVRQIRETLPAARQDLPLNASPPATRREGIFSSHEDALSTLFPNRITSFFPEHIQQQLASQDHRIDEAAEEVLENIEEELIPVEPEPLPVRELSVPEPVPTQGTASEPEDESLQRIQSAFQRLVKPSRHTAQTVPAPLASELRRVMDQELASGKLPRSAFKSAGCSSKPLLDDRRLDRMNEGKFQSLLRNNKHLSNNINRLADSYFSKNQPEDEGSWIPGI